MYISYSSNFFKITLDRLGFSRKYNDILIILWLNQQWDVSNFIRKALNISLILGATSKKEINLGGAHPKRVKHKKNFLICVFCPYLDVVKNKLLSWRSVQTLNNFGGISILEMINYISISGNSKQKNLPQQVFDFVVHTTKNYHFFTLPHTNNLFAKPCRIIHTC